MFEGAYELSIDKIGQNPYKNKHYVNATNTYRGYSNSNIRYRNTLSADTYEKTKENKKRDFKAILVAGAALTGIFFLAINKKNIKKLFKIEKKNDKNNQKIFAKAKDWFSNHFGKKQ